VQAATPGLFAAPPFGARCDRRRRRHLVGDIGDKAEPVVEVPVAEGVGMLAGRLEDHGVDDRDQLASASPVLQGRVNEPVRCDST